MTAPSPVGALIVFTMIVSGRLLLGPVNTLCFVIAFGILLIVVPSLRQPLRRALFGTAVGMFFVVVVAAGRWLGGTPLRQVVHDSLGTASLISSIALGLAVVAATFNPKRTLAFGDAIGLPRTVTYVLLAVLSSLRLVREYGSRLIRLLRLKGMIGGGLLNRGRSYYRLVAPLFTVAMTSQLIQARSLAFRGFFEQRGGTMERDLGLQKSDLVLVASGGAIAIVLRILGWE